MLTSRNPLFRNCTDTLVLASASPRRRELLAGLGLEFSVIPSRVEETPLDAEAPDPHVRRLSCEKALEVAGRAEVEGRWFLGSDTIVVQDGLLLGKPVDAQAAANMLESLSGRWHEVYSGFAVHDRHTGRTRHGVERTRVRFRELTAAEIAGYIATGEPRDKAGAYAIQGVGAFLVRAIEGSYTSVVGLPLSEVVDALLAVGAIRTAS